MSVVAHGPLVVFVRALGAFHFLLLLSLLNLPSVFGQKCWSELCRVRSDSSVTACRAV